MPIPHAALLALALLSATAAGAQDRRAQVLTLLRENGCAMTETDAERIFPPAKLTMDDVQGVAEELFDSGEGIAMPDGIGLSEAACRPAPDVLAEETVGSYPGCRALRADVAARVASLGGMGPEAAEAALDKLIGAGAARAEGGEVVLAECYEGAVP